MDRKNSNDGKKQRTSMHQGRRAQVAVEYKKDWVDPTKQSPSEAWRSNHCDWYNGRGFGWFWRWQWRPICRGTGGTEIASGTWCTIICGFDVWKKQSKKRTWCVANKQQQQRRRRRQLQRVFWREVGDSKLLIAVDMFNEIDNFFFKIKCCTTTTTFLNFFRRLSLTQIWQKSIFLTPLQLVVGHQTWQCCGEGRWAWFGPTV